MTDKVASFLKNYHGCDDGLVLAFGFFYSLENLLCAKAVFYARNHAVPADEWDTIEVVVKGVEEFSARWQANQPNSISSGVHVVKFSDLWCLDIDGVFEDVEDPASVEEVRKHGDCYVIGRDIDFHVTRNQKLDLNAKIHAI